MNNKKLTKEEVQKQIYNAGKKIKIIGEYNGSFIKTQFKCEVCGHEWVAIPNNIKSKNRKCSCPSCYGKRNGNSPLTKEEVDKRLEEKNIILLDKWETTNQPYNFKCKICDNEWKTWGSNVLTKRNSGCTKCADLRTSEGHQQYFANKLKSDYEKYGTYYSEYRFMVDKLTYRSNKYYTKFKRNRNMHIDHMFSVREAYEKGIDPVIVSCPINLQLLTREQNLLKSKNSCITEKELYNMYEKWLTENPEYINMLGLE